MKLLKIPIYRQSPAHCGPACLQMIFAYYGKKVSEKAIARRAKTTMESGTSPSGLVTAAKSYGLVGTWRCYGTVKEIKKYLDAKIPVIVNWFSENEGHYSVAVGIDDDHIWIADPETATRRKFDHETFTRVWFDFPGDRIEKPSNLKIRCYLPLERVEDLGKNASRSLASRFSKLRRFRSYVKVLPE